MRFGTVITLPWRALRYARGVWRDAIPAARRHGIRPGRIVREQIRFKFRNELQPVEYYRFGLDDPSIPWEEKLSYLGASRIRKIWRIMTPPRYHYVFKNKLVFKRVFGGAGLPLPTLHAVYDPHWGRTEDGQPFRTESDIRNWIASGRSRAPVFKPVESAEGRMVMVTRGRSPDAPDVLETLDGATLTARRIVEHFNDEEQLRVAYPGYAAPLRTFLVEERLLPHTALRELTAETFCCARILTLVTLDGRVEILHTSMKLQCDRSGIDNVAQGAMGIGVDLDTGVLGEGLLKDGLVGKRYTHLPETGKTFAGFRLPLWQEALDLARRAATVFPEAHTVGWDIGFTDHGVVLIEGNAAWGEWQGECRRGLLRGSFAETLAALAEREPIERGL